jgi:2-aminobenzoate-CoA ligase
MATWARMLEAQEAAPRDLSSLQRAYAMWQTASSAAVREGWKKRGLELMNNYGSTAFATWPLTPRLGEAFPPGSLGRPLPGYDVRTIPLGVEGATEPVAGGVGRMAVRGPTGLTYWERPDLQRRDVVDGWTLADDLIEFDASGNAAYLGRTDYLISTAGYKVAPAEVESVLAGHPAVREVAVIGAPDPIRQEVVMAFVAVADGVRAVDALAGELQDYVKASLSPYKYPRRIRFVDRLPRDGVGKVQGKVLKQWAALDAAGAEPG